MKSLLSQIVLIVALALITGLGVQGRSLLVLWNSSAVHAVETYAPQPVDRQFVQQWLNDGKLIVDARSGGDYQLGHISTAYSVAAGDLQAVQVVVDCCLKRQQLVVYCSSFDCSDSFTVGEALYVAGFSEIYLYEAGFSNWQHGENQ
jgi:rhodanese-related sulfurtransferase